MRSQTRIHRLSVLPAMVGVATAALVLLSSAAVLACGGVFCARPTPAAPQPEPVDQTAENILFVVHGDGTITATVQIQYTGEADDFAWVVPVPGVPSVRDASSATFERLDAETRPMVSLPAPIGCTPPQQNFGGGGGGGIGCGQADSDGGSASPAPQSMPMPSSSPVTVYDLGMTATYDYAVLGSSDTGELIGWLNDNGYNVSENMEPVMEPYNMDGMRFLALKLQADREASDIAPIEMTYESTEPMVPIQLTAVAAQPYMGIRVYIAADERYAPRNYDSVTPNARTMLYDGDGRVNYFDWVAREVEAGGGHRWITEYSGSNPLDGLEVVQGRMLSRFYTRMSPEHMTRDPIFRKASSLTPTTTGGIDLSGNMSLFTCDANFQLAVIPGREPSACAFNYCGPDATCHEIDGDAACVCSDGRVAQQVTGPDAQKVVCTPRDNPYGVTAQASGVGTVFDPCNDVSCGAGSCVVKSGFPACDCDAGAAARLDGSGFIECVAIADAPAFGPGGGLESAGLPAPIDPDVGTGAVVTPDDDSGPDRGWLAVLVIPAALGAGLALGRRRRRRD